MKEHTPFLVMLIGGAFMTAGALWKLVRQDREKLARLKKQLTELQKKGK